MYINNSKTDYIIIAILAIVAMCLCIVGVYLHVKIIKVSIKDKEMTWKLDITNSGILIFLNVNAIFMHSITYLIGDLYTYTGEWFCYTEKVIAHYGNLYGLGHSLIVSILKYVIIVHWHAARAYGNENITEAFFWLNFLYPILMISFELISRPDFFWAYDGYAQIDRCLGDPKHNWDPISNKSLTKLHNLCEFSVLSNENYLEYGIKIFRIMICWLTVVLTYVIAWNIIEMFLYHQIFKFMRR